MEEAKAATTRRPVFRPPPPTERPKSLKSLFSRRVPAHRQNRFTSRFIPKVKQQRQEEEEEEEVEEKEEEDIDKMMQALLDDSEEETMKKIMKAIMEETVKEEEEETPPTASGMEICRDWFV